MNFSRANATWLLVAAIAFATVAEAAAPKITLHRQDAGELGDDGWAEATSALGGYTVKFPAKFNDYTATHEDPKSAIEKSDVMNAVTLQKIRFGVTRAHFRGGKATARAAFNKLKAVAANSPEKHAKLMRMNNYEAIEQAFAVKGGMTIQRTVLVDEDMFTLLILFSTAQAAVAKRLAPTFFGSLTIQ